LQKTKTETTESSIHFSQLQALILKRATHMGSDLQNIHSTGEVVEGTPVMLVHLHKAYALEYVRATHCKCKEGASLEIRSENT
jgi:hypothetical protein